VCNCGFDLSGPGYDKTASSCAQDNECLGIITGRILLHQLLDYQFRQNMKLVGSSNILIFVVAACGT
jgi:hypothetical protein